MKEFQTKRRWQQVTEWALTWPLIMIGLVVSSLDLLGLLNVLPLHSQLASRAQALILLLLSWLALNFVLRRPRGINDLESMITDQANRVIRQLNGVEVKCLNSRREYWDYLTKKVLGAQTSVEDLTWGPAVDAPDAQATRKAFGRYKDAVQTVSTQRDDVVLREVFTFPADSRIAHVEKMMGLEAKNYYAKYFELKESIPLLQFAVIDGEEVILGTHHEPADECYLSIRHPDIAAKLSSYFSKIWREAHPIGDTAFLESLREKWPSRGSSEESPAGSGAEGKQIM